MKILLVEDDERIAEPIKEVLESQHYLVDTAGDGETAWNLAASWVYDLILLDVMLPRLDGVALCRRLRQSDYRGPILIITARGADQEKVLGLDSGADDYLVKPFGFDELGARIRALLRRNSSERNPNLRCGQLTLDPGACKVTYGDLPVDLTPTEYRLLAHFLRNPNQAFSREALIERLWLSEELPTEDVIKAHIKGLRSKLRSAGAPENIIETVYGFGYRLNNNHA